MGVMRFLVDSAQIRESSSDLYRAYLSGVDGRVFPTRVEIDGRVMTCRRHVSDSGRIHVPWPIRGFGTPFVSSASLPEREEPYLLALELARGKIAQLRDQVSSWEVAGMTLPDAFRLPFREAHRQFRAATAQQDQLAAAEQLAGESLRLAFEAAELVTGAYAAQRLAARRRRSLQLPAALGCGLGRYRPQPPLSSAFREAFTAAAVPVEWRDIEPVEGDYHWDISDEQVDWCLANRLIVYGGPLLDFAPGGLPAWLKTWERDFLNLQSFVCDYLETAVARYAGRIRHWDVCARANTGGALGLSEENRLSLVARALDVVRQVDNEVQLMIRIDQPWGEYQARGQHRLSPLQFVDAILRSGIGLSAVNLEVTFGYRPNGSAPRDALEISRLLDLWATLGIPLHVTLACPSGEAADPHSAPGTEVERGGWKREWSAAAQAEWLDFLLPLVMAKQAVVGIFWTHFSDQIAHELPNAGLVRADGTTKPALQTMTEHCRTHWRSDGDTVRADV